MSTDRPGDTSDSAGSPSQPSAARDDDKTNWKPVYAAIAIAVALTLATVLWINRPGTQVTSPPPSPVATSSVVPTLTPTPDPREAEIAKAQDVYEKYSDAMLAMAKAGGSKKSTEKIHQFTIGPNWEAVQIQAEGLRRTKIKVSGETIVNYNRAIAINAVGQEPELSLRVCLDQGQLTARDVDGNKVNPNWIRSKVDMVRVDGVWMINNRSDEVAESSCID